MTDDIFVRIKADVTGTPSAADLRETIRLVGVALNDEREFRAQFEQTATNPLVDTSEAMRAQAEITTSHLNERRLEEGLKLLRPKASETAEAERQVELVGIYEARKHARDAVVAEFRKVYPKHAAAIVGLLRKLQEFDGCIADVVTPTGFEPLMSADGVLNAKPSRSIAAHVRLPLITLTDAPLWDHEAEEAAAVAAAAHQARVRDEEAQTKQLRDRANMDRYGTTDPVELARKRREEAEAQRRIHEERRKSA